MRPIRCHIFGAILLTAGFASPAYPWGDEGHQIVAQIAQKFLTPAASRQVDALLADDGNDSLALIATWADRIKLARPETKPWHYVDIPVTRAGYLRSRDCAGDNCIVEQLKGFVAVLKDSGAESEARAEALKFVTHFAGDLHQPLHCADRSDRGGNELQVRYFGRPANLHRVWDTEILAASTSDRMEYADRLAATITPANVASWSKGTVESWANETHGLARTVAYGQLPRGAVPALGTPYQNVAAPVVDRQLKRAGVRLAALLNDALR